MRDDDDDDDDVDDDDDNDNDIVGGGTVQLAFKDSVICCRGGTIYCVEEEQAAY